MTAEQREGARLQLEARSSHDVWSRLDGIRSPTLRRLRSLRRPRTGRQLGGDRPRGSPAARCAATRAATCSRCRIRGHPPRSSPSSRSSRSSRTARVPPTERRPKRRNRRLPIALCRGMRKLDPTSRTAAWLAGLWRAAALYRGAPGGLSGPDVGVARDVADGRAPASLGDVDGELNAAQRSA